MAWTKEWTELWSEDRALADLRLLVQRIHQIVCLKLMDSQMKKTWQVSSWTFPRQGQLNQSVQPSRRGWNYPTFINFPHSLTSSRVLYKNSAPPQNSSGLYHHFPIFSYFHTCSPLAIWNCGYPGQNQLMISRPPGKQRLLLHWKHERSAWFLGSRTGRSGI